MNSFFVKEYSNEIYSISSEIWCERKNPGEAIMQTWVIKGGNAVMAIDSPVPELNGFKEFIKNTFQLPIVMVNSHGHIDHIGCNNQFAEVWIAKADWSLLYGDGISRCKLNKPERKLNYRLLDFQEGHVFDLGDRKLIAYHVPGHTLGSMVLYDINSKSLFSGDAVARRILYGLSDWTPLDMYLSALKRLSELDIENIYSMHDSFSLPKDMPERIIRNIEQHLGKSNCKWVSPTDGKEYRRILIGENESDIDYFDFVIPIEKMEGR